MSSGDARSWAQAGREALRRGRPQQAIRAFDRALALEDSDVIRVLRAQARALAGEAHAARAELLALGCHGARQARIEAARALLRLGAAAQAADVAEGLLAEVPRDRDALELVVHGESLGRIHEATAALQGLLDLSGRSPTLLVRMAARLVTFREHARALALAIDATRADPTSVEAWIVRARSADGVGLRDDAIAAAARAATLAGHEPERLRDVAIVRIAVGDPDGAERDLVRVLDLAARDAIAIAWLAELALWRNDLRRAEKLAGDALAIDTECARAHAVRGGVEVLRAAPERALVHLDRALEVSRDDAEAWDAKATATHWRGEALRQCARYDEAIAALDLAIALASRHLVSGHANRLLALIEQRASRSPFDRGVHEEHVLALEPLAGAASRAALAGEPDAVAAHLRRGLAALGGNRSVHPTRLDGTSLVAIPVRVHSRTAARHQQELLRTRPPEEVIAGFDALIATYGDLPTLHCHRGEVWLWIGRAEEAERCFERAIGLDRATRWAWIGLGAARLLRGDLDGAERAFADALVQAPPPPGRTLWVYRGELRLRRGDLDGAEDDLRRALHINPERISAQLLLLRVRAARGDRDHARALLARAREAAPGLLHDAAREVEGDDPDAIAARALAMMRGNRSAGFVTYFAGDRMRFVPPPRVRVVRHESGAP